MFRSFTICIASLVAVLAVAVCLFVLLFTDVSIMDRYVAATAAAVWICILGILTKADMHLASRRAFATVPSRKG